MRTPKKVRSLYLEATCVGIGKREWDRLMKNATIANQKVINNLVREHLPDLYVSLALHLRNYYKYYKTKTHLVLVHSSIEYFLAYE